MSICGRCKHPAGDHHESGGCASTTKKGRGCQCPSFTPKVETRLMPKPVFQPPTVPPTNSFLDILSWLIFLRMMERERK